MRAQGYEDEAWRQLANGNRKLAANTMREGARNSIGRGRAARMRDYAEAIEETELKTKAEIEAWLRNEIDPEEMGSDF